MKIIILIQDNSNSLKIPSKTTQNPSEFTHKYSELLNVLKISQNR